MISAILTILFLLGVGYIARILGLFKPQDVSILNKLVLYIFMPATVFYSIYNLNIDVSLLKLPLVGIIEVLLLLPLLMLITKKLESNLRGAYILTALFGNTAFIGYPVSLLTYGNEGLARAIIYDQIGFTISLTTIGVWIANYFGRNSSFSLKESLLGIITYPPFPLLILAFILRALKIPLPDFSLKALSYLSNATVPVIMIAIGGLLQLGFKVRYLKLALGTVFFKLILFPSVGLLLGLIFKLDSLSLRVLIIESGVPVMMSSVVLGSEYGLDVEFILTVILITTVLVLISLPLINSLLGMLIPS
ncbi:MAG: AEC family transporter [bacterium]